LKPAEAKRLKELEDKNKRLNKHCATYYDEHVLESSIEISAILGRGHLFQMQGFGLFTIMPAACLAGASKDKRLA
jgi:hypothetical protein